MVSCRSVRVCPDLVAQRIDVLHVFRIAELVEAVQQFFLQLRDILFEIFICFEAWIYVVQRLLLTGLRA